MFNSPNINSATQLSLVGNQTVDLSTAPTVVNSAYTTSASARPQVLSNGWIVTCANNTAEYLHFYVSKDNGATWSSLCYSNSIFTGGFALASKGTIVYLLGTQLTGTSNTFFYFDATTVTNGFLTVSSNPDTSQSSFGSGCSLAIDPTQTYLHATWSSKNATYPNSFNIRYAKGTINGDGSVTWGSVTQITTNNTTGTDVTNPVIVVRSTGNPTIIAQSTPTTAYSILAWNYNGSTWTASAGVSIYTGGSYAQSSPDAIVDKNGILWCAWHGRDSTDTIADNIRCKYSTDGGVIWINANGATEKLTSGNTYNQLTPSITFDSNNNICIVWRGVDSTISTTYSNLRKIVYTAGSWSAITTLTNNTTQSAINPSTCSNALDSLRYIYQDNQASAVRFDAIPRPKKIIPLFRDATPSIVTNQPYDISGNGGRKIVKLSNGWLVAVAYSSGDGRNFFYVSKNGGGTWQQLCYYINTGASGSLVSSGTIVYGLFVNPSATDNYLVKFDATTVANSDTGRLSTPDTGQASFSSGCSLTIDSLGYLHAAWVSKNSTYPNSFNIRYSKSTDGGVTWAAPTQVTVDNTSGTDNTNPCIVIKNNLPIIVYQRKVNSGGVGISCTYNTGTQWLNSGVYNDSTGLYIPYNPCSVVKRYGSNTGRIWTAWHGLDSTDTTKYNIRVSYSDDGGATWSAMAKITSGNTVDRKNVTLTEDTSGNVYAIYDDNGTITYQICPNGSTTFGTVTALNAGTNPQTLDNSSGMAFTKPPVIYMTMGSVQYDVAPRPQVVWSGVPPEIYIPLWWYSGSYSNSTFSIGSLWLQKGSNMNNSITVSTKLHTLDSWPVSTKFALEISAWCTSGTTGTIALWDMISNTEVSGTRITTTVTTATVLRSAQFSLVPGKVYGVSVGSSNGSSVYITDASLIVFPS